MSSFEIADCPTSLALAPSLGTLNGTLSLTVRNITAWTRTGRVLIEPDATSKPEWFSIEGATTSPREREFDFAPQATQTIKIAVTVPPGVPGGQHLLKVRVTAEQDPDNDFVESGAVAFTLPEPASPPVAPRKKFPWWVVALGGGVTVAIILGIALYPHGLKQPDLVGKMLADARKTLVTEGYAAEAITDRAATRTADQEPGTVVAVDYSQTRKAVLTIDPGVKVPATLRGLSQEAAESKLKGASFKIGLVSMVNHPGAADITVVAVTPAEGTPVKAGTAVALEVQQARPIQLAELNGERMLVNVMSDKCLTIAGGRTDNGVPAQQFDCNDDQSRRWTLKPMAGENIYQIVNVLTKKCLMMRGEWPFNNSDPAVQYDCDADAARMWQIRRGIGHTFMIANVNSRLCLTTAGFINTGNTPMAVQEFCDPGLSKRLWTIRAP